MNEKVNANIIDGASTLGNVTISVMRDGEVMKKITAHNTGTINMCDYIARALTGEYVVATRPGTILPFDTDGAQIGNGYPVINAKVGIPASYWNGYTDDEQSTDGGFCTAVLSFLIPSNYIENSTIGEFRLLSVDPSHKECAVVHLDTPLEIGSGSSLKVDWTIFVSYKWDIDRTIKNG